MVLNNLLMYLGLESTARDHGCTGWLARAMNRPTKLSRSLRFRRQQNVPRPIPANDAAAAARLSASPNPRRGLGLREESASPSLERSPEVKTRAQTLMAAAAPNRERKRTRIALPGMPRDSRRQRQTPLELGGRCCLPVGKSGVDDVSESAGAI